MCRLNWIALVAAMTVCGSVGAAAQKVVDPLAQASQPSPRALTALLTAVTRAGARLVAVGERGTILTSDDSGQNWTQRPSPVSVMLTNVRFVNAQKGWAVGHSAVVLHTSDGGLTWKKQLDGTQLAQVVLKNAEAQAGEGAQRALAEARQLVADGADKPLLDLLIQGDGGVLVIGAYGLAARTQDDGASWQDWHGRIPNAKGAHLYAACRVGEAIYLVGEQGAIFRSTDNAQSFKPVTVPYNGSFFGVTEAGEQGVLVFGLRGNALLSKDGGASWLKVNLPTAATITAGIKLQDGSTVLASQAGNVLRTTDAAASFEALKVSSPVPFVGLTQATDGTIVLAGVRGAARVSFKPSGPAAAASKNP